MPQTYEVEINGRIFEVDAPSLRAAIAAAKRMQPPPPPEAATRGMLPPSTMKGALVASETEPDAIDRALSLLPTAGGVAGGIVGGIGGTVAGIGVGGVPGAVGGATLGGAAGEAARQLIARARGAEAPATPLKAATDIGRAGAIQGTAEGVGAGMAGVARHGAQAVYRGFLKPPLSQRMAPRANRIVQTALDEALPITRGGMATGQRLIGELRAEVDDILKQSPGRIDLQAIAARVRAFAKRKYFKPGADLSDYKAALAVADRIDQHPALRASPTAFPRRYVSLAEANEAKRALDVSIGDTGFGVKTGAQRTTEKAGRRFTRKALEAAEPSIAPLNARESRLIDSARAIGQAVEREANRNALFGVPTLLAGGYAGAEYARGTHPAEAAAWGLAIRAGMHPAVASRVAIIASRMARTLGVGASTAARVAFFAASETQKEPKQDPDNP